MRASTESGEMPPCCFLTLAISKKIQPTNLGTGLTKHEFVFEMCQPLFGAQAISISDDLVFSFRLHFFPQINFALGHWCIVGGSLSKVCSGYPLNLRFPNALQFTKSSEKKTSKWNNMPTKDDIVASAKKKYTNT